MRHEGAMLRCDPAFRNAMKKSKKEGPKNEDAQGGRPRPLKTVTVVFREDAEGIHAMVDRRRASVSEHSPSVVSEGQSWKCMIDCKDPYRPEIIPLQLISEKPEAKEPLVEVPRVEERPEAVEVLVRSEETERLSEENARLERENAELRRKIWALERYKDLCEEKDKRIKDKDRTIDSLSTQVNVLNGKVSDKNIWALESRIEELGDDVESRDREIRMLRDRLKALGDEHVRVIPHLPPVMKAIKNGSTLRFKDSVEDGRYRVYVNPRSSRLLIVPDANGTVCCAGGEMRVPCMDLPSIGGETGPRRVGIDAVGDGWEVILE